MQLSLRNRASTNLFLFLDRVGVHLPPKHFNSPVEDYSWLRRHREAWESPSDMPGVRWDLDEQLAWVKDVCASYLGEVEGLMHYRSLQTSGLGYGYGPIESQVLHCFVRKFTPRRIIEVGSGVSTACMLDAVRRNEAEGRPSSDILCIEPNPKKQFTNVAGVVHVESMVQTVHPAVFDTLDAGDLLFIDSSHAVKTGSDVSVLLLQIIPKLRPGVHVHIHDIILDTAFGWQENPLLAALLTGNSRLRVTASMSGLHYGRQAQLRELLPDYRPQSWHSGLDSPGEDPELHFPSAIYLQVV